MVLHPLLSPLHYLLQVALQVLRSVAVQLVDNLLAVCLHGLLVDGLENFTLHIVLQFLPCVTPVSHTEDGGRETETDRNMLAHAVKLTDHSTYKVKP